MPRDFDSPGKSQSVHHWRFFTYFSHLAWVIPGQVFSLNVPTTRRAPCLFFVHLFSRTEYVKTSFVLKSYLTFMGASHSQRSFHSKQFLFLVDFRQGQFP